MVYISMLLVIDKQAKFYKPALIYVSYQDASKLRPYLWNLFYLLQAEPATFIQFTIFFFLLFIVIIIVRLNKLYFIKS